MISKDELRKMVILGQLSDAMLEKLLPLAERKHYEEREYIFREGDAAERFFLLKRGKILLEQRLSDKMTVSIDAIKPGYSFGWSALLQGGLEPYSRYTSDAISAEACEIFIIGGEDIRDLLESDHAMGYLLSIRLNRVIKQRLVHRTEQFLRIIKKHPDIDELIR
jgi:CRP/FNR family transcriptional regulator, cyclic AMP receptor protein